MTDRDPCMPGMVVRLMSGQAPMIIMRQISLATVEVWRIPAYPHATVMEEIRSCAQRCDTGRLVRLHSPDDLDPRYRDRVDPEYLRKIHRDLVGFVTPYFDFNLKELPMSAKLYQTTEPTPRFGTYLATNSQGQTVLEMKGTGAVEAFNSDQIEVVRPYTVEVKFAGDNQVAFQAKPGQVNVGDVVLLDGYTHVGRVIRVDTKFERATKQLSGVILTSTPINVSDVFEDLE